METWWSAATRETLLIGSYIFASMSFAWSWVLYTRVVSALVQSWDEVRQRLDRLWEQVNNHHDHRMADIEKRLHDLEDRR